MLRFLGFKKNNFKPLDQGMTFIELIVILGIFGAISATVLFNYQDFSSNVKSQNLAQDIALQIKQAQTDAVSGRIPSSALGSNQLVNSASLIPIDWKPSYGIAFNETSDNNWDLGGGGFVYYFNKATTPAAPQIDRYFDEFFSGSYDGCGADASEDSECLQEIKIISGDKIDMICFDFNNISDDISNEDCDGTTGNKAFISFTRPRANAEILDGTTEDDGTADSLKSNVFLRLSSPNGSHRYISVWASGYISIE
jgi:type II secretory pathway pseudopilin PulG